MTRSVRAFFDGFGVSEIGPVRPENQDAFVIGRTCVALADGMGGGGDGQGAANEAIAACADVAPGTAQEVAQLFRAANERVRSRVSGGTTLSVLSVIETNGVRVAAGNVGDGRTYVVTTDGIVQLSHDHTQAADLLRNGDTSIDVRLHPARNYLTQALGNPVVSPYVTEREVAADDVFVLCTDGVWGVMSDTAIYEIVHAAHRPKDAALDLVNRALLVGTRDNATAVVAAVRYQ